MEFSDCGSDIENNEEKHDQYILRSMDDEERNFKAVRDILNDKKVMDEKDEMSYEKIYYNKLIPVAEKPPAVFKIFKTSQGKSPKEEKSEQRPDNMRKRIKVNFCNCYLKKKMNDQLQDPESKKLNLEFANWSQFFVTNYYKEHNRIFLNQTFREFILDDSFKKGKKLIPLDFVNYENNYKILIYLENKNSNNSELNTTLNLKIKDLYNEYLHSDEFQNSIEILETYGKNNEYIDIYIRVANDFVNYYCSSKK